MKALSLWQPWASLMDFAAKMNETRGWTTSYRGPLLICATKKFDEDCRALAARPDFAGELQRAATYPHTLSGSVRIEASIANRWLRLPIGVALCVVDLVDCIAVTEAYADALTERERTFGNYDLSDGPRFAWVTTNLRRLNAPIPVKGAQGLWSVSAELEHQVRASLVATCKHCGCTHEFACPNGCGWAADGVCTNCVEGKRGAHGGVRSSR